MEVLQNALTAGVFYRGGRTQVTAMNPKELLKKIHNVSVIHEAGAL